MKDKPTTRQLLISAITDFARDEFETVESVIKLASKSEHELIEELINITEYFRTRQ